MFISYKLFITQGFIFNIEACYEEIWSLNRSLLLVYNSNEQFFYNTHNDIDNFLNDKHLKTKFNLEFYDIDSYIYLNLIIKSTYFISYDCIYNEYSLSSGMLHRNVVLSNINESTKVFKILNIKTDIVKNTIKLIMCLAESIHQKKIIIRVKGGIKCNFYVKLNLITNLDYADRLYINFSQVEMKSFNNYFIGASHLTLSSFIKKANFQSLKNNINCDAIIKLSKQPIYIDFSKWELIKKNVIRRIKQEYNLNITEDATISSIINELSDQRNDQTIIMNQYKMKGRIEYNSKKMHLNENIDGVEAGVNVYNKNLQIKDLRNDKTNMKIDHSDKDFNELSLRSEEIFTENNDFSEEDLRQIELYTKNLSKEIQRLYYILAAEKAKLFTYPIYIPHYYDFRGRIYPKSVIGFTYLKVCRALFKLSEFDLSVNLLDLKESIYFKRISNLNVIIDVRFNKPELNEVDKYFLIIHLLELGKYNKGALATTNGLTLQNLIDNGTELFFNKNNVDLDVDDLVYIDIIKDNIIYFFNNNKFKNITIIRDATASFLQHWSIKLKAKKEYLSKLNLNGDVWYDTYIFIIDTFLKENAEFESKTNFKKILKRSVLKKFYNDNKLQCWFTQMSC